VVCWPGCFFGTGADGADGLMVLMVWVVCGLGGLLARLFFRSVAWVS